MTKATRDSLIALALLAIVSAFIVLAVKLPEINAWEKAAGYPYGHLCDLYNTCGR